MVMTKAAKVTITVDPADLQLIDAALRHYSKAVVHRMGGSCECVLHRTLDLALFENNPNAAEHQTNVLIQKLGLR